MAPIPTTTAEALLESYDVLLLDAYGVLVNAEGAFPGARTLLQNIEKAGREYFIVTNDASRLESTTAARYRSFGLPIPDDKVITSGGLLTRYFEEHNLQGARCAVLGPPDSFQYVERAGGVALAPPWTDPEQLDALILCDEAGFDFLPAMDAALSLCIQAVQAQRPLKLILPNPDLIYPQRAGLFGFAAGTMAGMLESALRLKFPDQPPPRFVRLGKPHRAIFEAADARAQGRKVMVGDQLATDIKGARAYGLDAVLVTWGVSPAIPESLPDTERPSALLRQLPGQNL